MTYNPQEWASGRQSAEPRIRRDCYGEPLHTPPPPYTGQQDQRPLGSNFRSPEASQSTTPVQEVGETSSYGRPIPLTVNTGSRQAYDTRRATHMNTVAYNPAQSYQQYQPRQSVAGPSSNSLSFQGNRSSSDGNHLPPPPPPRKTSPNLPPEPEPNPISRLSYATRRSTSAGPTPTAGPSVTRALRTMSNTDQRGQAAPLPGPPSVPPPASRSRSATGQLDTAHDQGASVRRPPRLTLRNSNLTPIPATPNSIASGTSTKPAPFPLRIDTGMASGQGKAPAVIPLVQTHEPETNRNSQAGPSALARRSAVRGPGPAARSSAQIGQMRSRSKSIGRAEVNEPPPSTTMSNNPWASALESARSPQEESLPESALLPTLNGTVATASGLGKSHTPPTTPSSYPLEIAGNTHPHAQQTKVLPTPPLSQKPLLSANSVGDSQDLEQVLVQEEDDFITQALDRHEQFLRLEQEASTDLERLMLFTQFMNQESMIRKERYITAFRSDGFDIEAAKLMLFNGAKARRASGRDIPRVGNESPRQAQVNSLNRADSNWMKDYHPQLSPIASMDYDEMSSRGRAPSRWWESATGSQSDGGGHAIRRSKRESKYMSLSTKLMQDMETSEMEPLYEEALGHYGQHYPSEKANPDSFGYYEEETTPGLSTQQSQRHTAHQSALDISRFITLPPPYPRHYPAVNNNHPDLSEYRTTVRMLSDLHDAKNRQSRHKTSVEAMRADRQKKTAEIRRTFKASIQAQIVSGEISFAEAAEAEKLVKAEEHDIERQGLQAEFDTLQDVVINPLHDQMNERIEHLSTSLQSLQRELLASAANQDPDQPVQEGDDVPELLEQLTQLKWLFEARESLHSEHFDLLSQRNDAYKAIVALPYTQTHNIDKIRDTEAFFDKDAATRYATFCAEALKRHESFLQFVEENALRGIELQSSAFWDITPNLVDLLQKIPTDLDRLDIQIPEQELQENPAYREYPQQYLYTLLRHAQKSTYQFIEGQINLYCLVHEVKTSSLAAHYKASKAQQKMAGDQSIDLADTRLEDESELTDELKNRAAMIEEQWLDALGKHFHAVEARVKQHLQDREAWEEVSVEE